MFNPMPDT